MAVFFESLILGMRTFSYSSNCGSEEPEGANPKEGGGARETITDIGVIFLSLFIAVAVFILLPLLLSNLLSRLVQSGTWELVNPSEKRKPEKPHPLRHTVKFIRLYLDLIIRLPHGNRIAFFVFHHNALQNCLSADAR